MRLQASMNTVLTTLIFALAFSWSLSFSANCSNAQESLKTPDRNEWVKTRFGRKLNGSEEYKITAVFLDIPKNADQEMQYGLDSKMLNAPNLGPFESPNSQLKSARIDDPATIQWIQDSFQSFARLETLGSSAYGRLGTVTIVTNEERFDISVTERGFTLGDGLPNRKNTFYSWELAKLIDNEARRQFKTGLKPSYFDLLSGQLRIERSKDNYNHLFRNSKQ